MPLSTHLVICILVRIHPCQSKDKNQDTGTGAISEYADLNITLWCKVQNYSFVVRTAMPRVALRA